MTPDDIPALGETLAAVFLAYGKSITPKLVEVWYGSLSTYDLEALNRAMYAHLRNPDSGQFPPRPSDVVRLIEGSTGDRAMDAWALVERTIRQIGPIASVAFPSGVIHRVIEDMGGWVRLCETGTEEDLRFRGIEFQKRCRSFWMGNDRLAKDYPAYLIGSAEAFNRAQGRPFKTEVELIGRTETAKLRSERVMSEGYPIGGMHPVKRMIAGMQHLKLVKGPTQGGGDTRQNALAGPKEPQSGQTPPDGSGSIPSAAPAAK